MPAGFPKDWEQIRVRVLYRDGWVCHWCGGRAEAVDHLIERDAGGSHAMENLVASCTPCNSRRSAAYRVAKARRRAAGASRAWLTGVF
jgi:5-methylcytosine-specific restriction endonuclease McrA